MHDENYKRIFAFPRVIEDLLRAFVPGDWLEEVDLRPWANCRPST
jgi:hypothetical protein